MGLNGLIIVIVEMVLIFHLETKNRAMHFISHGLLLTALSFLVYIFLPFPIFTALLSVILVTMGEILAMPFMNNYWAGRASSLNRGQYAGYYTMAWSFAQVLGPTGEPGLRVIGVSTAQVDIRSHMSDRRNIISNCEIVIVRNYFPPKTFSINQ
jgi:hypothetical protein